MEIPFNLAYKRYYKIIEEARLLNRVKLTRDHPDYEYFENHHVIPDALGGSNSWRNMVLLTPEEHYICHSLLPDFCEGESKYKMLVAWVLMNGNLNEDLVSLKIIGSEKYGHLRREYQIYLAGPNGPRVKAVYKIDITSGKILKRFYSMTEASYEEKIHIENISECCSGKIRTAGGFIWRLVENFELIEVLETIEKIKNSNTGNPKEVYKLDRDTGKVLEKYKSIESASYANNALRISACCWGVDKTSGNYIWCFVLDYTKEKAKLLVKRAQEDLRGNPKKVLKIDRVTDQILKIYNSMTEASLDNIGISISSISMCCSGKTTRAGDFKWAII